LPAIGSRIYGISDAIEEGVTGLLHRPGDVKDIAAQMRNLADDPERCSAMGRAARSRALDEFSGARLTQAWVSLYRELLG
jgi:glycosyltransferase involved in cell wall biosynthesis